MNINTKTVIWCLFIMMFAAGGLCYGVYSMNLWVLITSVVVEVFCVFVGILAVLELDRFNKKMDRGFREMQSMVGLS